MNKKSCSVKQVAVKKKAAISDSPGIYNYRSG
jgi:hypothetical protein